MDAITQIGCIVCLVHFNAPATPGCPHHMLDEGGRRIGHLATICLCDPGHHQNGGDKKISRHPNKARFEQAYGSEESLLSRSRAIVEVRFGLTFPEVLAGVDIDRIHYKLEAVRRG